MYYALPPSLQTVLEHAKDLRAEEDFRRLLDAFLRALSTLGTPPSILYALRKHCHLIGAMTENARDGASELEFILRQHDLLLGPDLGGFANLFKSAIADEEICTDEEIDFDGLEDELKEQLRPLGKANLEISALCDVSDVFSVRADRVAACIVMDALCKWVDEQIVVTWMQDQPHLHSTLQLFNQRDHLAQITAQFVQRDLAESDLKDFSLWYLSRFLSGSLTIPPFERRLADTMLRKAELGSLSTFENVGFSR